MHDHSIRVTDDFYEAVKAYQKTHNIASWSQALVKLAAQGLGYTGTATKQWGVGRWENKQKEKAE